MAFIANGKVRSVSIILVLKICTQQSKYLSQMHVVFFFLKKIITFREWIRCLCFHLSEI